MTDTQALSRLLSGELSQDQAEALRTRLSAEPALAAQYASLQALVEDLEALSDVEVVPEAVLLAARAATADHRASSASATRSPTADVGSETPAARSGRSRARLPPASLLLAFLGGAGLAAAAAGLLAVGLGLRSPSGSSAATRITSLPVLTLAEGQQHVVGEGVLLMAGPARVQVDGEAWITVEPAPGSARRHGQEDPMDHTHALAAAAGAAVTVTVVTGAALVWPEGGADAAALVVEQGSTRSFGGASSTGAPRAVSPSAPDVPESTVDLEALAPEVAGWLGRLREDNERLRFENQLLEGQLELARGGAPVPFPDELHERYRPDGFARHAADVAARLDDVSLLREDCDEYPCLAVLALSPGLDESATRETVGRLGEALAEGLDDPRTFVSLSVHDDDDNPAQGVAIVSMVPPETSEQDLEAMEPRLRERTRRLEDELRDGGE